MSRRNRPLTTATTTTTDCAYPRRDGQAELAWVVSLYIETIHCQTVIHLTNLVQHTANFIDVPNDVTTKPSCRFWGPPASPGKLQKRLKRLYMSVLTFHIWLRILQHYVHHHRMTRQSTVTGTRYHMTALYVGVH